MGRNPLSMYVVSERTWSTSTVAVVGSSDDALWLWLVKRNGWMGRLRRRGCNYFGGRVLNHFIVSLT